MAYAFDQLTNMLNQQDQTGTGGQQSIFNPTIPQASNGGSQSTAPAPVANDSVKTDASGDIGSGVGSNVSGGASTTSTGASTAQSLRPDLSAYAQNAGKASAPSSFQNIQDQISQNQTNLQNTADQYVSQGESAQKYGVSNDTINQAVAGDQGAKSAVSGLLNQSTLNPVSAWQSPDVSVNDANYLSSDQGLRQLISRGQGPNYTPGMSAFDMTMLRSSPDFQNLISKIQGSYSGLQSKANDYATSKPQEVYDYGKLQLGSAQGAAKGTLQDIQKQITDAEQKAADQANANLETYKQGGSKTDQAAQLQAARDKLTKDWQASNQRAVQFINQAQVDPSQFASFAGGYNPSQFVTADQANQFNNISSLLNQSQSQAASLPLSAQMGFDQTGAYNALAQQAQAARNTQDASDQAQKAQIMQAASDYAKQYNTQSSQQIANQDLQKQLTLAGYKGLSSDLIPYYTPNAVNVSNYLKPTAYTADQVLNAQQANQMNSLNKDLGLSANPYAAANLNPYQFDQTGYQTALTNAVNKQKADTLAAQAQYAKLTPPPTVGNTQIMMPNDPRAGLQTLPPNMQAAFQPGQLLAQNYGWGVQFPT